MKFRKVLDLCVLIAPLISLIVFEGIYAFFYAFYHVISLKQISTSWIVDRDFKNEKYGISPKKNARKTQDPAPRK